MQTILITGGSKGIGYATVKKFLNEGWNVITTSIGGKVDIESDHLIVIPLDYLKPESIASTVETIKKLSTPIDILVNNVGILLEHEDNELDIQKLRQTFEVNVVGTIDLTERILAESLVKSGGHIVNISSGTGLLSDEIRNEWVCTSYRISKAGINMYTKTLAFRLKEKGIVVFAITPGWVKTQMGGDEAPRTPEEAAEVIFWLATQKSIETGSFWQQREKRNW